MTFTEGMYLPLVGQGTKHKLIIQFPFANNTSADHFLSFSAISRFNVHERRVRYRPLNYVDIKTRMINYLAIYEFPGRDYRYAHAGASFIRIITVGRNKEWEELNFV